MRRISYRYYALGVLGIVEGYNGLDRVAWSLVLQDIKLDFDLSDTELGLLSGIAFALFYSVMGIPIARWADRGFRVSVISLTTALSAAMVALCGATQTLIQLLLVRVGVAIGDAGSRPPAHSLIASYFVRAERARAMSVFELLSYVILIGGTWLIGWSNELYGWRVTFVLIGLPGFVVAAIAWLTLREPKDEVAVVDIAAGCHAATAPRANPSLKDVVTTLWLNRTFRLLLCAWSISTFLESGIAQWSAAFFVRSHGMGTGELGTWLSSIWILSMVGVYAGGELASRYAPNNEVLQLSAIAWAFAVYGLLSAGIYLAPSIFVAFAIKAIVTLGVVATVGPTLAIFLSLIPATMRAMSMAVLLLISNLVGMGIGPLAVGALSDALAPLVGQESLRYALVIASPGYVLVAFYVWRSRESVIHDLAFLNMSRSRSSAARQEAVE